MLHTLQFQMKNLRQALSRQGKFLSAELDNIHKIIGGLHHESKELRNRIEVMRSIKKEMREDLRFISPLRRPMKKKSRLLRNYSDPHQLTRPKLMVPADAPTPTDELAYSSELN